MKSINQKGSAVAKLLGTDEKEKTIGDYCTEHDQVCSKYGPESEQAKRKRAEINNIYGLDVKTAMDGLLGLLGVYTVQPWEVENYLDWQLLHLPYLKGGNKNENM